MMQRERTGPQVVGRHGLVQRERIASMLEKFEGISIGHLQQCVWRLCSADDRCVGLKGADTAGYCAHDNAFSSLGWILPLVGVWEQMKTVMEGMAFSGIPPSQITHISFSSQLYSGTLYSVFRLAVFGRCGLVTEHCNHKNQVREWLVVAWVSTIRATPNMLELTWIYCPSQAGVCENQTDKCGKRADNHASKAPIPEYWRWEEWRYCKP